MIDGLEIDRLSHNPFLTDYENKDWKEKYNDDRRAVLQNREATKKGEVNPK